jgi:hypothetical protein
MTRGRSGTGSQLRKGREIMAKLVALAPDHAKWKDDLDSEQFRSEPRTRSSLHGRLTLRQSGCAVALPRLPIEAGA